MISCSDAIKNATGKDHTVEEIDDFIKAADKIKNQIMRDESISNKEAAIFEALDNYNAEMIEAAKIEKRNALINQKRRAEAIDFIQNSFPEDLGRGVQALIAGDNQVAYGSRMSVDAEQKSIKAQYLNGLISDLEQSGLLKAAQSTEFDRNIGRAMWGEKVDDDIAQGIADTFSKYQEMSRIEANQAGAWIKKDPNYITRQSHDIDKIAKATEAEWRAIIEPKLSERTFLEIDDKDDFFKSLYTALSSGIHLSQGEKELAAAFKGSANVGKKLSQGRLLHFKSADDWMDYNDLFGTSGITESVLRGLESSADSTALMRKLGTNPESMIDVVYDDLLKAADTGEDRVAISESRRKTDDLMATATGQTLIAGNKMLAAVGSNTRAVLSMSKLGGALLSSIGSDNVAYAAEVRYQGGNMFSGLTESIKAIGSGRGTMEQRKIAANLGVSMDSFIGNLSSRFNVNDPTRGLSQKLMNTFFRWNGLSWWTDALKVSAAIGSSNRLFQAKDLPLDKVDSRLSRVMKLYGIESAEWDIVRKGYETDDTGTGLLTPEGQKKIADGDYISYLNNKGVAPTKTAIRELRSELERKVRNYVSDRQGFAVLESDTRSNATWQRGTQRGTVQGELLRSIAQFKQFPTIFLQRVIGREVTGKAKGSLPDAKFTDSPMYGVASLMTALTIAGYVSMSAKDIAKGREPRQFNDDAANNAKIMAAAMVQGGGLGIYGDFIFGDMNRFGGNPLSTAAGPSLGLASDIVSLWQKAKNGDDASAQAFTLALNNTPFLNLFYSRLALDYMLLYDIRESMNPGYLKRMEKRIKKNNNQEFMFPPSKYAQ